MKKPVMAGGRALLLSAGLMVVIGTPARAQEAAAPAQPAATPDPSAEPTELEAVVVTGDAAMIDEALRRQRASDNIRNVVNADAIGNFPDANAAESLQRVPGLSIERDQGEGRFVRVRGLGPELNSVTINGAKVPSPEAGTRAVALDIIPTELLESLDVTKALTPDQDADSLGGSIDVRPLSAFDRDGLYYRLSAAGSHDEHSGEGGGKFALAASNRFLFSGGSELGLAGGYSFEDRNFGSDNVEAQDNWDFDDGVAALGEFEQRDYELTRERTGLTLSADFRLSEGHSWYARYLDSGFKDTEQRLSKGIAFLEEDDGELEDTEIEAGETADAATVTRELKKRTETLDVQSLVLGGKHELDRWGLDYSLAFSESSEDTPRSIDGAAFEGEFEDVGFNNTRKPQPFSANDIDDVGEYELDGIELAETYTEDKDNSLRIDLSRKFELAGKPAQFKFGYKGARREKIATGTVWVLEDFEDIGFEEDELGFDRFATGPVDYELGNFGPGISSNALNAFLADPRIDLADFLDDTESAISDYSVEEDIDAGYGMLRLEADKLHLVTGVRYERTQFSASGMRLEDGVGADGLIAVNVDKDYDNWLPSLHLRYEIAKDLLLRGAYTQSLVRPSFEQARPGGILEEDDGEIAAELGNPDLRPIRARNFDIGAEWYLGRANALTAFVFYKDITDFIYNTDLAGTPGFTEFGGLPFDEVLIARNGDSAHVLGLELSYVHQFGGGFLVNANLTLSDSEAEIEASDGGDLVSRKIPLPSQSDVSFNMAVGYETRRFQVRLSGNYKSDYLFAVSDPLDAAQDIYQDDHLQLDFSARLTLIEGLRMQLEVLNLNDEPYYAFINRRSINAQYEEYGPTYKLGLVYTNF